MHDFCKYWIYISRCFPFLIHQLFLSDFIHIHDFIVLLFVAILISMSPSQNFLLRSRTIYLLIYCAYSFAVPCVAPTEDVQNQIHNLLHDCTERIFNKLENMRQIVHENYTQKAINNRKSTRVLMVHYVETVWPS